MPLEFTDAELATAASACRAMAYQSAARRYAALAENLEAARKKYAAAA